jgi:hypothetical protein
MVPSTSFRLLIFGPAVLLISCLAAAQTKASCSFKLFDLPKSTSSVLHAVNDSGTVVGSAPVQLPYPSASAFARTANGKVTYYCAPSADCTNYSSYTYFTGVNDADIEVGVYKTPGASDPEGFMLKGSTFTAIQEPNSVWGTYVSGINKSNAVVGYYLDNQDNDHGFLRSSDGSYTTLDFAGAQNTVPLGINDRDEIVGYYSDPNSSPQGFAYHDGEWKTLDYPGVSFTELYGRSNAGVIIGYAGAASGPGTAFLYENGEFKVIAVPNTYSTGANGISADGLIVGMTNLNNTQAGWRGFMATCK